jgi:uncharacterized protein DUF5658
MHGFVAAASGEFKEKYPAAGRDYDESGLPRTPVYPDSVGVKQSIRPSPDDWVSAPSAPDERRSRPDRRHRHWWSILYGSFNPRRRRPARRLHDSRYHSVDWHSAHLLAVSIGILILSVADAFLTVVLLSHGAIEVNPVMAALVKNVAVFASLKMAMTGISVMLMVFLARYRFMRIVPVQVVLYGVLATYMILVGYEVGLLQKLMTLPLF